MIGGNLRHGGFQALTMRCGANGYCQRATWFDANGCRLDGQRTEAQRRRLDVDTDAESEVPALAGGGGLLLAEPLQIEDGDCLVQRLCWGHRVVEQTGGSGIR